MATARTKSSDHTGREAARLAKENQAELARRSKEMSLATAVEEEERSQVVDLTGEADPIVYAEEEEATETQVVESDLPPGQPFVEVRVNETLNQITIGAGTFYDFEEGRTYKVPRLVADHLEEKGYLWH